MRKPLLAAVICLAGLSFAFQRAERPRDHERPAYTRERAEIWLDRARRRDDHIVRKFEQVQREAADYRALAAALEPVDDDVADALVDIADALDEQAEATQELLEELRDD